MTEMVEHLIRFILDKALTSYYAAMEEQVSIIVSIITALLTGGFIILFLENQHLGARVIERYHFIMNPFMHRLSNYFKFVSYAMSGFSINKGVKKDDAVYVFIFGDLMNKLGNYAHDCIIGGRDYPSSKFSAQQLQSLCENINNVWYCWDDKQNYMFEYCTYDNNVARLFEKDMRDFLNEVFPHKYSNAQISLDLIGEVSGQFYAEVYCPIEHVPYEYENWCKQERWFQTSTLITVGICLLSLIIILFARYFIPLCAMNVLAVICVAALAYCLYKFYKIERLARELFR